MAAVFFDIDGTLIDREGKIEDSTIRAVRQLKEKGHDVYINSGRTRVYIYHPDLLALPFDGLLCGCGTNLFLKGEEIFYQALQPEELQRMIARLDHYDVPVIVEGRDWLYMDEEKICRDPYGKRLYQTMEAKIRPVAGNTEIEGSKFTCVISFMTKDQIRETEEAFRGAYAMANHDDHVLELTPRNCSKAIAIEEICRRTGVSPADTYAFGDGINDIEMLQYAGRGIAMGNARQPAKAAADYVTDDIHEDGIWNALLHFGLL